MYIHSEKNKSQACIANFKEAGSCRETFFFRAASSMNNMGSLAAMPVSISSPPCPEAAASRGRKD